MKKLLLTLILGSSLLTIGCAKEKVASTPDVDPPSVVEPINTDTGVPGAPDGPGIGSGFGATASLEIDNNTLEAFLTKPVNSPSDIQVHVDLQENSNETFSGIVSIYVTDRGVARSYSFSTGPKSKSAYNRFVRNDNGFHAILDDGNAGMIVLVIDDIVNLGDGLGNQDTVNGQIYYKNYPTIFGYGGVPQAPHPLQNGGSAYCWEITKGPYQCKPWASLAESINEPWPTGDVILLGYFKGLSISGALNLD